MHVQVTRTMLRLEAERTLIEISDMKSARYPRNDRPFTNTSLRMASEQRRIECAAPKLDRRTCWKREQ